MKILKCSSWYLSEPVGLEDAEWFVNGVALLETALNPKALLDRLLEIETLMGRKRTVRWGPRTIDLDLLCYDQLIIDSPGLTIPHPEMDKRRFVLYPMSEIAPEYRHPLLQKTVAQLRDALGSEDQALERIAT